MDPLRMTIATVPLSGYLLMIGFFNVRSRPTVVSGARDNLLLGIAVMGLIVIGPFELLLPESTAFRFGGYAWVMLVAFYLLSVALAAMVSRPRIVVYNSDPETIRPALAQTVRILDEQARWAGDSVVLPTIGMQLYMDRYAIMRNVQLKPIGIDQPFSAWVELEKELRSELKSVKCERHASGAVLMMMAATILSVAATTYWREHAELARLFQEMIQR